MKDKNEIELKDGDIIDIHQTVNGYSQFIIISQNPLDIRYEYDPLRKYEYDKEDLLKPCQFSGEVDWEIIGSIGNDSDGFKIFHMKNFFVLLLNTFFYPFTMLYNILHRHSSTALFNPKALEILSDPKKYEEMEKCINEYYKTGKWDYDKINQIIND
jgi:hypothetical protein